MVVCAGAINTPQLLLLSGIGPREQLQQLGIDVVVDQKWVGESLSDVRVDALLCHLDLRGSGRVVDFLGVTISIQLLGR